MHTTYTEALWLVTSIHQGVVEKNYAQDIDIMVAPPYIWLQPVCTVLRESPVEVGAQNMYTEARGAYTGEISPVMLASAGVRWVILGHSERRHIMGETNDLIHKKCLTAFEYGLQPILCVGEKLDERESGRTLEIIRKQIETALEGLTGENVPVIAYEPVWAIGTGHAATPEQAEEVHAFITELVHSHYGPDVHPRILYGGSVKPNNIAGFIKQPHIHGALVGGASLKPESFLGIIENALDVIKNS